MNAPTSTVSYAAIIGPGQTLPVALVGTQFYFAVATAPVFARSSGGVWCEYYQGTGQKTGRQFHSVEVQNPNPNAVTIQIVCGSEDFIDKRLIQNQASQYVINGFDALDWIPSGESWSLTIPDLSGSVFLDPSGKKWIAVSRSSLSVQNPSTLLCTVSSGTGLAQLAIAVVQASSDGQFAMPSVFNASGGFSLSFGPSDSTPLTNVFEVYQAVAPGFAGVPPN